MELTCDDCGRKNHRVKYYDDFEAKLCQSCFRTWRDNPVKYIPPVGEIHFDDEGKLICHICGRSYHKLGAHIKQKHDISTDKYKEKFGLNRGAKLTSKSVQDVFRKNTANLENLTKNRIPFKKGHSASKGQKRRLQTIKDRTGTHYKTKSDKQKKGL